jgi:transcriptional regulator with XRE-family HTH domain
VARERAGLTQIELARELGLSSNSMVSGWETGNSEPMASNILRLAEVLQVSPVHLFLGEHRPTQAPAVHEQIVYHAPPAGVSLAAWKEILPLLPALSRIYDARNTKEHSRRWDWITGNIQTFAELVGRDLPNPQNASPRKKDDSHENPGGW